MREVTLAEKLDYKPYRQTRLDLAQWVIDRPETFPELLDYCFQIDDDISFKATWILEYICTKDLNFIIPHLDPFFENIPRIYKDQALRPMAKIVEMLAIAYYKKKDSLVIKALTISYKESMVDCCFGWLISKQKVACQVYSMSALFFLGTEIEWVHPELKSTIEQNIYNGSAAYKARGKAVLAKIDKHHR